MRHIIDLLHTQFLKALFEDLDKGFPCPMGNTLTISPGVIGGTSHSCQIILPLIGLYRSTSQLPVGQADAISPHRPFHYPQVVVADLMSEASGAGMDEEQYLPDLVDAHSFGRSLVIDFSYYLHL